jgi:hypothetical protein
MDLEVGDLPPIRQATVNDLEDAFARAWNGPLALGRNYGDRLEATGAGSGRYCLAYYDAASGKRYEAHEQATHEQVKDAFFNYLHGHWNWHHGRTWQLK